MAVSMTPAVVWAETDGRAAQQIEMSFIPDVFVGEFAEAQATATSGLPVVFEVSGPCALRAVDGPGVIVATTAGVCAVTASQPGNEAFGPAVPITQSFEFMKAEADVQGSIVGSSLIAAGTPFSVDVQTYGERGDVPAPGGRIVVKIDGKGVGEAPREVGEFVLDPQGHAVVPIPAEGTAGLPDGEYVIYLLYFGDNGYLNDRANDVPLWIGDTCTGQSACVGNKPTWVQVRFKPTDPPIPMYGTFNFGQVSEWPLVALLRVTTSTGTWPIAVTIGHTYKRGICAMFKHDDGNGVFRFEVRATGECAFRVYLPWTDTTEESHVDFVVRSTCDTPQCRSFKVAPEDGELGLVGSDPTQADTGRTVQLKAEPTDTAVAAPEVAVAPGEAVHVGVPWSPVGERVLVRFRDNDQWNSLGYATVGADGVAWLPTFIAEHEGAYTLRLVDGRTGYVRVIVDENCPGAKCPSSG